MTAYVSEWANAAELHHQLREAIRRQLLERIEFGADVATIKLTAASFTELVNELATATAKAAGDVELKIPEPRLAPGGIPCAGDHLMVTHADGYAEVVAVANVHTLRDGFSVTMAKQFSSSSPIVSVRPEETRRVIMDAIDRVLALPDLPDHTLHLYTDDGKPPTEIALPSKWRIAIPYCDRPRRFEIRNARNEVQVSGTLEAHQTLFEINLASE